ncbi:cytidylate kinase-like family protein, partial [bacterium]|nr:cytidylate kinase-like family protein [bacterium]
MKIVCVSRGSYSKGKEFAEVLAKKLDYRCISREELTEEAIKNGIAVGKLETAMLKPHILNEKLVLEKEHFQAFCAVYLLEKVLENDIVYHGRSAHLLFPVIDHILRIRIVADKEYRIASVMQRLNLDREKAKAYVEGVDEDHKRWVHLFYGVDWDSAIHYDVILNVQKMNVENASSAICSLSQMPDFNLTPAMRK